MSQIKKIGLITLFKNNYGSILQCYSTKMLLNEYGFECVVLEEKIENRIWNYCSNVIKNAYRSLRYPGYFNDKTKMKKAMKTETSLVSDDSIRKMNQFVNQYLCPKQVSIDEIKTIEIEYDCFIFGSDQIWNASRDISDFYFLDFISPNKKIALAPSIGVDAIPKFNNKIKKKIQKFKELSLREETAIGVVKSFYMGAIVRVGDPVLFFKANDWRKIYCSEEIDSVEGKYILIHFLNKPSQLAVDNIKEFIHRNSLEAIVISNDYNELKQIDGIKLKYASPFEYLCLIDNSFAVFTDSFHTTLFSIIFETTFYTYPRQYIHGKNQSSRILDMLGRYNLNDHYITGKDQLSTIDSKIDSGILEEDSTMTRNYLLSRLGVL